MAWGRDSETKPTVLTLSSLNLFTEEKCNTSYDISGTSGIGKNREQFLPNLFNSKVICAGSTVSKFNIPIHNVFKAYVCQNTNL